MSHNPAWKQEFEQSRSSILQATDGWLSDVRHIGSTSLEESIARPVVDILAGISDLQGLNECSFLIEGLNFQRVATPEWCEEEFCALLLKPRVGEATHSVLVVKYGGQLWERSLAIRQRLATDQDEWQRLLQMKLEHFQPGCSAAQNYADAKREFFADLERRIALG
jgi:GrpB-like predicted nucleotidyltransferase (UPF0157 family)